MPVNSQGRLGVGQAHQDEWPGQRDAAHGGHMADGNAAAFRWSAPGGSGLRTLSLALF